jgi:ubiquinone/menaquinone biosynthesis C-methylase UbiE
MVANYRDLFRSTAWYYARYWEGYPAEFFDVLKEKFKLNKNDRVLDLGCGTGQIAIPLSAFVKEVVAMDPEPGMITEGREQEKLKNCFNITWTVGGSSELPVLKERLGIFKLVTIGTAFHWMDREKTLDDLYEIIIDNGGIAIARNTSIWNNPAIEWQKAVSQVIKKYLGEERRAGSGTFKVAPIRHEVFVENSSFKNMEIWKQHWERASTLDEVIGNLYSTSMANTSVLGNLKEAFEGDLKDELMKTCSAGIFKSEGDMEAIIAWKQL